MHVLAENNTKPAYDKVIRDIADYVLDTKITSKIAYETAHLALMDSLGCALLALNFTACEQLLGPVVPKAVFPGGARVPGTSYELDPIQAAFNIGTMIRWLDFNDTWLGQEWGHPSDNLGAILAISDYIGRKGSGPQLLMQDILTAMIKAYEIQGCIALENSFNCQGLDHVFLVKLASTAVSLLLLGVDKDKLHCGLSQVFVDGASLRTYRHAPNTGSRKSWAAGDATSRGVRIALLTCLGEIGYPSALTAVNWGFYEVLFKGEAFKFQRPYASYVMENILFKVSYPAEFHAQTAVECAINLHYAAKVKLNDIARIEIHTQAAAIKIISKKGPLYNPADRDHCLQYMVAIALIYGTLNALHYEDNIAAFPLIDILREKMIVIENTEFSKDYHSPNKRSIASSVQRFFKDGSSSELVTIEYPLGHKKRRTEGVPALLDKFKRNLATRYSEQQINLILDKITDLDKLLLMPVNDFMSLWIP